MKIRIQYQRSELSRCQRPYQQKQHGYKQPAVGADDGNIHDSSNEHVGAGPLKPEDTLPCASRLWFPGEFCNESYGGKANSSSSRAQRRSNAL